MTLDSGCCCLIVFRTGHCGAVRYGPLTLDRCRWLDEIKLCILTKPNEALIWYGLKTVSAITVKYG